MSGPTERRDRDGGCGRLPPVDSLRVMVVGSGGREHALAWRLSRDADVARVFVAPGNDGMARDFVRLAVREDDAAALASAAREHAVNLVVIGPEAPLAAGVADALVAAGVRTFGASAAAARLESSKWFAKEICLAAGVPTAAGERFEGAGEAIEALARFGPPWVIKADGLAAGKGVRVTSDRAEAEAFVRDCLERDRFGASGRAVVLERFLDGEERSVMAVCDGARFVLLPPARDFKRAFDGDAGPNTGGMGAFAPAPLEPRGLERVGAEIVAPVLAEMARRGAPFRGALYCGLMWTARGPEVIEFNARFGDPETQSIVAVTDGAFARLLASAADGRVDERAVRAADGAAVTVALVDEGYPDAVRGGGAIDGLDDVESRTGARVFHAGTTRDGATWRIRGGRAAYVTATGATAAEARERAYGAVDGLSGTGWRCRRDIAAAMTAAGAGGGTR